MTTSSLGPILRFAGAKTFLVIGADAVARGLSQGQVWLVVGVLLLILLVVLLAVLWRLCGHHIRLRYDVWWFTRRHGPPEGFYQNVGEVRERFLALPSRPIFE